jgi:hypothetical protein
MKKVRLLLVPAIALATSVPSFGNMVTIKDGLSVPLEQTIGFKVSGVGDEYFSETDTGSGLGREDTSVNGLAGAGGFSETDSVVSYDSVKTIYACASRNLSAFSVDNKISYSDDFDASTFTSIGTVDAATSVTLPIYDSDNNNVAATHGIALKFTATQTLDVDGNYVADALTHTDASVAYDAGIAIPGAINMIGMTTAQVDQTCTLAETIDAHWLELGTLSMVNPTQRVALHGDYQTAIRLETTFQ